MQSGKLGSVLLRHYHRGVVGAVGIVAALSSAPLLAATPVQIYPLGDSITYGYTDPVETPGGYRRYLNARLNAAGLYHLFVGTYNANPSKVMIDEGQEYHDGHGGYRIDQDDTDLDGYADAGTDDGGYWLPGITGRAPIYPDVVIIHLGTNDIGEGYDPSYVYPDGLNYEDPADVAQFVTDMTGRLQTLVEKIFTERPDARVVLSSIIPLIDYSTGAVDTVTPSYATAVENLVSYEKSLGYPIVYAPAFEAFTTESKSGIYHSDPHYYGLDGVHPSALGYEIMANIYSKAVQIVLYSGSGDTVSEKPKTDAHLPSRTH